MIFKIEHTSGDTCGNEWVEGEPEYLEAKSLEDAWKKLKSPAVCYYRLNNEWIFFSRTPKGQGNGIWEDNPDFNWDRDKKKATGFKAGAFKSIQVTLIKVGR